MSPPHRRAVALAGAALALTWGGAAAAQAAHESGAESAAIDSELISVSFASSALDRSVAFYTQVLGMTQARVIDSPTERKIRMDFPRGGAGLLLIAPKGPSEQVAAPMIGRINIEVTDLRAVEARLAAMGYSLKVPIAESQEYKVLFAVGTDPDGNELEMVQHLR